MLISSPPGRQRDDLARHALCIRVLTPRLTQGRVGVSEGSVGRLKLAET